MNRFFEIAKQTIARSISTMLIYRANLAFYFLFESMFLASHFLTVGLGFQLAGGSIAGWTANEAFLLSAISSFTHQIFICFFINALFMLPMHVWSGQFDFVLMKPLHPFFASWSISEIAVSNLPNLLVNFILVLHFAMISPSAQPPLDILSCVAAIICGIGVRVGFAMLCVAPVFFSERLVGVEESYWSISGLGRYPFTVYPKWLNCTLTYILPIAAVAYLPAGAFHGKFTGVELITSMVASILFCLWSYFIFMFSLKKYQSVNSGI